MRDEGTVSPSGIDMLSITLICSSGEGAPPPGTASRPIFLTIMFSSMFKMIAPVPYIYYISAVLLGIGILVGLIGSWLSVTRYLRETK